MEANTRVAVFELDEDREAALYYRYPNQTEPQPVYLELNLAKRALSCGFYVGPGDAMPESVRHGRVRRYKIPCLTAAAANLLMNNGKVQELAGRICDGHATVWNGFNDVERLDGAAEVAERELGELLSTDRFFGDDDLVGVRDAREWLAVAYRGRLEQAQALGIEPYTKDAELDRIADRIRKEAHGEGIYVLEGLDAHLKACRQETIDLFAETLGNEVGALQEKLARHHAGHVLLEKLSESSATPEKVLRDVAEYLTVQGQGPQAEALERAARSLDQARERTEQTR